MSAEVIFTKSADRNAIESAGLIDFDAFWNVEKTMDDAGGIESKRTHKSGKEVLRDTCKLEIGGRRYFLKRSCGKSFKAVLYELEARKVLPQFGLTSSGYSVYGLDSSSKRAFILLDDMPDFICYEQYVERKASPEQFAAFEEKIDQFMSTVLDAFNKFAKSAYMYRDWDRNHLFFKPETGEVGLIDLERFMHISCFPLYYRIPWVKKYKRKKEVKKLASALGMDIEELTRKLNKFNVSLHA